MKNKIKIIFFLMVVGQYVGAQVYPYNFTVDSTNFDSMFMPFQMKIGGNIRNYKVPLENLKTHINEGATTYTAAQILDSMLTVDGAGSGLDADLLDGQSGAYYLDYTNATNTAQVVEFADTASVIATKTDVANAGSGISGLTQNYIPKSNAAGDNISNSQVFDNGTNVGIGTASPSEKLHILGSINSQFSALVKNTNTGASASARFETQNNLSEKLTFAIYSSNFSPVGIVKPSSAAITSNAANGLSVGSTTSNADLTFVAGGISSVAVKISGTNQNVGIGTTTPAEKLHVAGNIRFSGALMPNNAAGTSGQYLTSAGAGAPPTWTTLSAFANGGNSFSGTATLGTNDNHPLVFETVNAERMRILTNGNVGIGTASPSEKLHISGNTIITGNTLLGTGVLDEKLVVDGNAFIDQKLFVGSKPSSSIWQGTIISGTNTALKISTTSTSLDASVKFGETDSDAVVPSQIIRYGSNHATVANRKVLALSQTNADPIELRTSGTAHFHLAGDGDIGMGTVSPEHDIHIEDSATAAALIRTTGGAFSAGVLFENAADDSDSWFTYRDGAGVYVIGQSDDQPFSVENRALEITKTTFRIWETILLGETGNVLIAKGSGTPEGNLSADIGSTYHRTDGGAGTSFYVKESGTGNTGWVAK